MRLPARSAGASVPRSELYSTVWCWKRDNMAAGSSVSPLSQAFACNTVTSANSLAS